MDAGLVLVSRPAGAAPTCVRPPGSPANGDQQPGWYLGLHVLFVLVVVELLCPQHKVSLLPVLHDGPLFLQPAHLDGPLQRVGGGRLVEGGHLLAGHHAPGPSYGEEQTGRLAEGHEAACRGWAPRPQGKPQGARPSQARLTGPGLQEGRSPEPPRGSRGACSGRGLARDREAGDSRRPDAYAVRRPRPALSFCKEKGWLEPSEEEVAAASDKRCFLFPAWESVSDKRENSARSAASGTPTQLRRQPEAGRALSPGQELARPLGPRHPAASLPSRSRNPCPVHAPNVQEAGTSLNAPAQCH